MLKIDIHTHILPPEIPKYSEIFGYNGFIRLQKSPGCHHADMISDTGQFFRRVEPNCFDPAVRIQECDHHQVDVQVLSTVPVMFSYWTKPQDGDYVARSLNDHLASVVQSNTQRFLGLGTLPMQSTEHSIKEIERGISELKLSGFQIGSNINQVNLSDSQFFPIYEALEASGAALFVHPWEMMGEKDMGKYWLPWLVGMPAETSRAICSMIFGGVFARYPKLRVAFAHGGGAYPITAGRIQHGFDVRPDLCAIDNKQAPNSYLGHFWVDSLVHDPDALKFLIKKIGSNKICLGTDYPFPLGELTPGEVVEQSDLSVEEKTNIYHQAALNWLNVNPRRFMKET